MSKRKPADKPEQKVTEPAAPAVAAPEPAAAAKPRRRVVARAGGHVDHGDGRGWVLEGR